MGIAAIAVGHGQRRACSGLWQITTAAIRGRYEEPRPARRFVGQVGLSVPGADSTRVYALIETNRRRPHVRRCGRDVEEDQRHRTSASAFLLHARYPIEGQGTRWIPERQHLQIHRRSRITNARRMATIDLWIAPGDQPMIEANDGGATVTSTADSRGRTKTTRRRSSTVF